MEISRQELPFAGSRGGTSMDWRKLVTHGTSAPWKIRRWLSPGGALRAVCCISLWCYSAWCISIGILAPVTRMCTCASVLVCVGMCMSEGDMRTEVCVCFGAKLFGALLVFIPSRGFCLMCFGCRGLERGKLWVVFRGSVSHMRIAFCFFCFARANIFVCF